MDAIMKARFRYPLNIGPDAIFESGAAATMIGQKADGFEVVGARLTAPNEIQLTLEGEVPDDIVSSFQYRSMSISMDQDDVDGG